MFQLVTGILWKNRFLAESHKMSEIEQVENWVGLQQEKKHYHLVVRVGGPASLGPSSFPPFHLSFLPYRLSRGWHRGNLNNWAVLWALTSQPALALHMEILVPSLQLCLCFVSPHPPKGPRVHLLVLL